MKAMGQDDSVAIATSRKRKEPEEKSTDLL